MLWLLLTSLLCVLYIYITILLYPGNVPSLPGRLPLIGHIWMIGRNSLGIWKMAKKFSQFMSKNGDVMLFYFGIVPIYVVSDPDDCSKVLNTCLHKSGIIKRITKQFLGDSLLFGPASIWKHRRKLLNPTFNQQVLDGFMDIFNIQSRRLVDDLKSRVNHGPIDQHFLLEKNTLETICMTTAGVDITEESSFNEKCLLAFRDTLANVCRRIKNPLYLIDKFYAKSEIKKKEDYYVGIIHDLINRVLIKHREEYQPQLVEHTAESETKFKPFLHRLVDVKDVQIDDKAIQDEMKNIILTGFETSSTILSYTILLLGTYPLIQEKCYKEICEIFGESDIDVSKHDLTQLKYLEAVLRETIRYCPVVPMTVRIITEDIQLKNVVLRKDHMCIISLYGVLHHPIWGPDVEEFKPERWLDPGSLPQNSNVFGAFGYGKRNCIGKTYALMTMKVTLAHVIRHFKIFGNYNNMRVKNKGINKPAYGHEINLELRNK